MTEVTEELGRLKSRQDTFEQSLKEKRQQINELKEDRTKTEKQLEIAIEANGMWRHYDTVNETNETPFKTINLCYYECNNNQHHIA